MLNKDYICRKMFFRVLWPSLVSSLALAMANMADALVVGNRMGETGLAAIGIVTPLYMIYNVIGFAFSTGGCVTHSRLTAAGKDAAAVGNFKQMTRAVLLVSLGFAVLGIVFLDAVLKLLGAGIAQPELHRMCREYARPLFLGTPFFLMNLLLYDFVRCDDGARLASLGFSLGCFADLGLNLLFVLGLGWGVAGSAWATVIAQVISVFVISQHFFTEKGVLNIRALRQTPVSAGNGFNVGRSVRLGLSTSARYVFQFLILVMGNRLLLLAGRGGLIDGEIYVAVFDMVINVSYLIYGLYQAFSNTMQPLASTFAAEHGADNLRCLIRTALGVGLAIGVSAALLITALRLPIARLFGVKDGEALAVAARAIPIFCLSTPFAGVTIILMGFYQSIGKEVLASLTALFRTLVFLLPVSFRVGFFFSHEFWWIFVISEVGALAALMIAVRIDRKRHAGTENAVVFSAMMDQDNHELARVLSDLERFCERQDIPAKQAMLLQLTVEELCAVTIAKAFTGRPDEYIQLTVAREEDGDYVLHIRNSAPYFNPLTMRMDRLGAGEEDDIMESMGVMLVKSRAKELHYRIFQGFNVMTVTL